MVLGLKGKRAVQNRVEVPNIAPDSKTWETLVKAKDNYTCQECRYSNGTKAWLQAHHVDKNPELVLIITNGYCLCQDCHLHLHKGTMYIEDVAHKLRISPGSVLGLIDSGLLKARKSSTSEKWIIKQQNLVDYLNSPY